MTLLNFILLSGMLLMHSNAEDNHTINLDDYLWKNRLLLVFTPTEQDSGYIAFQKEQEKLNSEIADRVLVIFHIFQSGNSFFDDKPIAKSSVDSLTKIYKPEPDKLTLVLIGKDGGEKMRQTGTVDLKAVFDRIDAMPMRQREMRLRKKK
jgi:hypothetical protein